MNLTVIDEIDRDIIRILQVEGRSTQREVGAQVGLSPNAAGARINRLLERGVISGIRAEVDQAALGRPIDAWVDCWLAPGGDRDRFEAVVATTSASPRPRISTGRVDFRLRIAVGVAGRPR